MDTFLTVLAVFGIALGVIMLIFCIVALVYLWRHRDDDDWHNGSGGGGGSSDSSMNYYISTTNW